MKNKILTKCITGLVLSATSLAGFTSHGSKQDFTDTLTSYAVISGGALNIAGDSYIDRDLAANAAVIIGAGKASKAQNIYSGAAVTIGTLATVEDITSHAAVTTGGLATTRNIHTKAAITLGAFSKAHDVYAGTAITYGAGSKINEQIGNADLLLANGGKIKGPDTLAKALSLIDKLQASLNSLGDNFIYVFEPLSTVMGGEIKWTPGLYEGTGLTLDANSTVILDSSGAEPVINDSPIKTHHVWLFNLSQALSVGANTTFLINKNGNHPDSTYSIIWNINAALNLGQSTSFLGTALVKGAVSAASSTLQCGHLYAKGIVSVGSIGKQKELGQPQSKDLCGNPADLKRLRDIIDEQRIRAK